MNLPGEFTGCDTIALDLPALAENRLEAERARPAREHAARCARCARELTELRTLVELIGSEPEPSLEELGHARLGLRRAMVRAAAAPQEPRRTVAAWRGVLVRAAVFLLSTSFLTSVLHFSSGRLERPLLPLASANKTPAESDGTTLLSWVRSVQSSARSRISPWIPELSMPDLLEMLPEPGDRRAPSFLYPRNG